MYAIRKITTIIFGLIFVCFEFCIKLIATIPAITVTVILTVFGFKTVLESDSYKSVFTYCTFWNLTHQFYLSAKIIDIMDPDMEQYQRS